MRSHILSHRDPSHPPLALVPAKRREHWRDRGLHTDTHGATQGQAASSSASSTGPPQHRADGSATSCRRARAPTSGSSSPSARVAQQARGDVARTSAHGWRSSAVGHANLGCKRRNSASGSRGPCAVRTIQADIQQVAAKIKEAPNDNWYADDGLREGGAGDRAPAQ